MTEFRAAVVQAPGVLGDTEAAITHFDALLARAAATEASLVVFPEAFIGGYPKGQTFGATVGERTADGRALFARYRHGAIDLRSPAYDRLRRAAARSGAHVVVGVIERANGTLYCTALLLAPDGTQLARHRKLIPTGTERLIWGSGTEADIVVTDTDLGRVGMAICWENYMPLYRTALYEQGVQIYCAPTVDARDTWTATMRHISVEGRCYVLSANQYAVPSDYPPDFPVSTVDGVTIRGGSCILDPYGTFLSPATLDKQTILTADLDPAALDGAYLDLDVTGHYSRPDLLRLTRPLQLNPPGQRVGDAG
jgi:nitrilase